LKRATIIITFLILASSLVPAQGNTYVNAGIGIPFKPDDFSKLWKTGFGVGGGLDIPIVDWIDFTAGIDYNSFSLNEKKFIESQGWSSAEVEVAGGTVSVLTVMAGAKVKLISIPKKFSAYVSGTVGYLNFSTEDLGVRGSSVAGTLASNEESAFSAAAGGGVEMPFTKDLTLYLEGRYVLGTVEDRTFYLPIRLGLKVSF